MAGKQSDWWPSKLKYLEANYERCKLKVRQDSLYCKLFILEYQNRLEEEKRITVKYEKYSVYQQLQQAEQKHLELKNEKELTVQKALEDLSNVEEEWKEKTDKLLKEIESLQEENANEIKSKDNYILELTNELHGLRRLLQSKETRVTKNAGEQPGSKGGLGRTNKTSEQNILNTTTTVETQTPDFVEAKNANTVSENTSEENRGKSSVDLDEEKCLEKEVGSVLEVTEEMLKRCRRRSVLKRKSKSEVYDYVPANNSDNVELSEWTKLDKSRRERRVTFNGELEFKLPDGSKEVAELAVDDSSEQLETHGGQNGREDVFDDILSRETEAVGEELDYERSAVTETRLGGDLEEQVPAITNRSEDVEGDGHEAKSKTGIWENPGEGKESQEDIMEAVILLSADRKSQDVQLKSGSGDSVETKRNNKTQSKKVPSEELVSAQLGETGGRERNNGPKRGIRTCGNKDMKPSKRLLDVFGNEVQLNQAGDKEIENNRRKEAERKTKERKTNKTSSLPPDEDDFQEEEKIVDKKCGIQQGQNIVSKHNKKEDEVFTGKAGKRQKKRSQTKVNELDGLEVSTEMKERKATLRSKKRKSPEPEKDEESNDGKKNENENQCREIDNTIGIAEERERHEQVETNLRSKKKGKPPKRAKKEKNSESGKQEAENVCVEERETDENEIIMENNQRRTNLRSKKRKLPEFEVNENQNDQASDVNAMNENEKAGEINESEIGRKTTRGSKKRKSLEREIDEIVDLSKRKETVGVGLEDHESWEEISKKKQTGKKTKTGRRSTIAVKSAAETTKAGKEREGVDETNAGDKQNAMKSGEVDGEKKENNKKSNKRGERKRVLVEKEENEAETESGVVDEMVDMEDKENNGKKTQSKGRKQELAVTGKNEINEKNDGVERCGKRRSTMKSNKEGIIDKKELPTNKQAKPTNKKRRTLYSIRENTTFLNATSSIFQETLPVNQTSTGMPPSLSSFMKAFVIPKLKKK